jgi:hypothetical protein
VLAQSEPFEEGGEAMPRVERVWRRLPTGEERTVAENIWSSIDTDLTTIELSHSGEVAIQPGDIVSSGELPFAVIADRVLSVQEIEGGVVRTRIRYQFPEIVA